MLPDLVIDEIFSFLDHRSIQHLRGVCRYFNQTAVPLLLRFHCAKNFSCIGYQGFIVKYGRFVRVLEIHATGFECFKEMGLPLATVFPNLHYISLHWTGLRLQSQLDAFGEECLKLGGLKRVCVHQELHDNSTYIADSVVERTKALCAKSIPFSKLKLCFLWNTVDDFMLKYPPFLERCSKEKPTNLVVYSDYQYEFSMKLSSITACNSRLLKGDGDLEKDGPLYRTDSLKSFKELSSLVEHCMVHYKVDEDDSTEYLYDFKHMPSLDLDLVAHGNALDIFNEQFQATRLSLTVCPSELTDFFRWTYECFPNLQHLYLNTPVPNHLPP
ncbi:hypothetical protein DSO57_1031032 [Entomophthora muscae]|uniref:Uncharacterized protein n=1 Tax=Entomophthora muscae TaxID=34485 RepID=A0ACC2S318_9FUNG|nr:hypothetical protein DSO57_1031032 [Entomophthora muscae]